MAALDVSLILLKIDKAQYVGYVDRDLRLH